MGAVLRVPGRCRAHLGTVHVLEDFLPMQRRLLISFPLQRWSGAAQERHSAGCACLGAAPWQLGIPACLGSLHVN